VVWGHLENFGREDSQPANTMDTIFCQGADGGRHQVMMFSGVFSQTRQKGLHELLKDGAGSCTKFFGCEKKKVGKDNVRPKNGKIGNP